MTTRQSRHDHGRAAKAVDLIIALRKLPLTSSARGLVRELEELFAPTAERNTDVRDLIARVPGDSLAQKAERIGIPKGSIWAIWRGKFRPKPEIIAMIEAAAEERVDA